MTNKEQLQANNELIGEMTTKLLNKLLPQPKYMHNIMVDATTASGHWHYQFELENDVETAYTQTGQVGHYLFTKDSRLRIPATGLCVYNGDKYWITAVKATTDNMLTFEMYNIVDGTFKDDISSGAVEVTDVVS